MQASVGSSKQRKMCSNFTRRWYLVEVGVEVGLKVRVEVGVEVRVVVVVAVVAVVVVIIITVADLINIAGLMLFECELT